jgi:hypothetical protein
MVFLVGITDKDILVYDIETYIEDGAIDANTNEFRLFGAYSYKTNKHYILTDLGDIQKIINAHKTIVGFNIEGDKQEPGYDNHLLRRYGIKFYNKNIVDLMHIIKKRATSMKVKEGMLNDLLMEHSLDFITRTLHLVDDESAKIHIDKKLFKKKQWTVEENKVMCEYLKRDIDVTKKLFEWLCDYFSVFSGFLSEVDVKNYNIITDTTAKMVYKEICYAVDWEPKYNREHYDNEEDEEKISGGYVSYPSGEEFHSVALYDNTVYDGTVKTIYNIILLDFASLYPHIMIQCCLLNRMKLVDINGEIRKLWNGGGVWQVTGNYYADVMSKIAKLQRKLFYLRMYFKRKFVLVDEQLVVGMKKADKYIGKKIYTVNVNNVKDLELNINILTEELANEYIKLSSSPDSREFSCKIPLNTSYGILDTPYYELVYDKIAAQDCTLIGEQWIKYARKVFKENGYGTAYTDTDSIYILDYFNDMNRLMKVKKQIIDYIKSTVADPQLTFDMEMECEIQHLFFFKGADKKNKIETDLDEEDLRNKKDYGLLQKNYIYVKKGKFDNPRDAIVIKNLGIRKKSVSPLSRKIFWDYLVPQIVDKGIVKFSRTYLKNLIMELLDKDITLACMRKSVKRLESYKDSPEGIQAQIAKMYGPGIHFLIPNLKNRGVGKGVKICTLEEFMEHNMTVSDIDMTNFWSELKYFIKPVITKNIFEY